MVQDNIKRAIFLMVLSSFSFALMQLMVRFAEGIPFFEKVFFRNFVGVLALAILIYRNKARFVPRFNNLKLLLLRSTFGTLGVACNFYAISRLSMADATILNRISPFFVIVIAAISLKEQTNRTQWIALAGAFFGVLMIVKPTWSLEVIPSVVGLLSAFFAGSAYVILRALKNREDPLTIVFFFSLFSTLVLTIPTVRGFVVPDITAWTALLGIGIFAMLGQIFMTHAYRYAPAGEISIYSYTMVAFSMVLGRIFFAEVPDLFSAIGIMCVIGAALYLYFKGKKRHANS